MLSKYELLLFNRELLFLIEQHSTCTDSSLKEILMTQIALMLAVLS
ncbi:hypothetical protein PSE10B_57470 [Pseudomonas amygdali pv. eriobotryae]|nr:hypothetical protein PSE10B_57470 [Pseudomonas amygdali pv. eriobotryae]